MDRREALRLLATGAALPFVPNNILPRLREARLLLGPEPAPRTLNPRQYDTVKAMGEMILPRTDTPGAADVGAADFVDLILTEWYDADQRSRFVSGVADVDVRSRSLFGADFVGCTPVQQAEMLRDLGDRMLEEAGTAAPDQTRRRRAPRLQMSKNFYSMLRGLTLTAYYTSEAGATQELHFEMIPDRYDGCAELPSGTGSRGNQ